MTEAELRTTIIAQDKTLMALQEKLFEAGKLADEQQLTIDKQGAAIGKALQRLENAHQTLHQDNRIRTLHWIAEAMEILAND